MRPRLTVPPKLQRGDRVAVLSPSFAAPERFPERHAVSLQRIRDELGLEPVEYPTTSRSSTPAERAADLNAAFGDPSVRAVFATIGGDDQLTVLPHLDPDIVRGDPKPFFGYSDNTNLLVWLWSLGIAGYHGGSTIVHLGRSANLSAVSTESLRWAVFETGERELVAPPTFSEDELSWLDPASPTTPPQEQPALPWSWHQPHTVVRGPTWGGNVEVLHWLLAAHRWIHPAADYAGCVLLLESSEELPSDAEVYRILRNAGERGLLRQFPAVLVARARATDVFHPVPIAERPAYRAAQRAAVLRAFAEYAPETMIVFDVDFGHTDPQYVLPYGGEITVDGPGRRVVAHY